MINIENSICVYVGMYLKMYLYMYVSLFNYVFLTCKLSNGIVIILPLTGNYEKKKKLHHLKYMIMWHEVLCILNS